MIQTSNLRREEAGAIQAFPEADARSISGAGVGWEKHRPPILEYAQASAQRSSNPESASLIARLEEPRNVLERRWRRLENDIEAAHESWKPPRGSIDTAHRLARAILILGGAPNDMFLEGDGFLTIVWHRKSKRVEIGIGPDGEVFGYASEAGSDLEWPIDAEMDLNSIPSRFWAGFEIS